MASASVRLLPVCFAFNFSISLLLRSRSKRQPGRPSESFRSSTLLQQIVPAVPGSKPAVEEVVTLLAGNLEADVTETLSRDNGLLTLAANGDCPEFHRSPPQPCSFFLVGQFVSERFQILVGLL